MIYTYNNFNMISYHDVDIERDNLVSSYGDEPHELLLADVDYDDRVKIDQYTEFLDYHSSNVSLVPIDDFNDFITDKLSNDQVISELMAKKRAGVWPYTAISIDMDKIVEETKSDLGVDEVELDNTEYCVFENV